MTENVIGVIIPNADNSFFSSLADQIERKLAEEDSQTLILSCENNTEKEKEAFRTLVQLHADGIICVSGFSVFPDDLIPEDDPLVWVDRVPESKRQIPWVANDDEAAMEQAASYLLNKGCRNILLAPGFIAENRESPRVRGYRKALESFHVPFRKEYILNRKGIDSSEKETEQLVRTCLAEDYKPDGIITSSDRAAFGAITALRSVGYYVPEDVKLISFDNSPYSALANVPVTALDRREDLLAEKAAEKILHLIHKEPVETETIIPVSLVERTSTR